MMTPADDRTLSIMWRYCQFNRRKPHLQVLMWHLIVSPMDWLRLEGGGGCFYSRVCCNWWEWVRTRLSCRSGLRETGLCSFVAVWFVANCLVSFIVLIVRKASVQFSRSVVSDSWRPHGLQHTRLPCPSPASGAYSDSCPSSQWCHPTISSSVIPFSSCRQVLVIMS